MITTIQQNSVESKKVEALLSAPPEKPFKRKIHWLNVFVFLTLHLLYLYSWIFILPFQKWQTIFYVMGSAFFTGIGITAGSHRYYAHKTYKARTPLKIFLMLVQTMSGQDTIIAWALDHRQHHKYSDTDADPHNAHNGFFFSHIGWLLSERHPLVKEKRKTIDISDLTSDPIIMFQKKYYKYLVIGLSAIFILIPYYLLGESFYVSYMLGFIWRYVYLLNNTWFVNSVAHIFGNKPYDKGILPVENAIIGFLTTGEGWHNYHHAFPWDYRAAELGLRYSFTTFMIDAWAYLGLAYDLKTTSDNLVKNKVVKRGDGSHHVWSPNNETATILNKAVL